jgi:hypothetical protein
MWWPPQLGKPLPRAAEAVGVHHKLETYSLVVEHSSGGPKAIRFARLLSIAHRDVDHLAAEIAAGLLGAPVTRVVFKADGTLGCGVLVPVRGVGFHEKRVVAVTTGWELRYVGDKPRLVTAFIGDR